ncbi:MAG: very short patch repair endonuclease [Spirochaetia bacterium]
MSHIRSKNTKPELYLRSALHRLGFRFRLHSTSLPGKPDIVLKKYQTAVFINGCFWHGHKNCKRAALPEANHEFWLEKIEKNRSRDRQTYRKLQRLHWHVIVVWQCRLMKNKNIIDKLADRIKGNYHSN